MRIELLFWICIYSWNYAQCLIDHTGVDIGYSCKHDTECKAGNGGEYSKCNQDLNICICTINHLGEDKCMHDSDTYYRVCRPKTLDIEPGICTLECSPKGTIKWKENQDWYGEIVQPFAPFILDKKTSVCYDPMRALNSVPDGFEIKMSTIPNAGLGAFTNIYIEQDTMFGPYKGTFDEDTESAEDSGYSWKIDTREGEDRADIVWVDAKDIALSNWLRYVDTPINAATENIVAVQHKGEIFYQAFKSIQPGTELFVWYGETYGEFLGIEKFDSPRYYYANPGYVGGSCEAEEEGSHCLYDKNTVCADQTCFCIPGTHFRAGMCTSDETLGGICARSNGETCKHDKNAMCQRGVCICKINTTPANGVCALDETFGGRCVGRNGENCLLDNNTECVNGICRCRYGTTGIGGVCITDETYQGRCIGDDGEACELDQNAKCLDSLCVCKENASAINGKCQLDETLGGKCLSKDGLSCTMDEQAICYNGICVCKKGTTDVDGKCITDGFLRGMCMEGNCLGPNLVCDTESNSCVCQSSHFPHAGKCVKE
ncbi:uncharacterized protein LOC123525313 [Mercenaria mercenaria]|uniref:uncharacterized protein LOC123525313 n=1 Tax=Mercenaria mercenaria TaxID=6596 RepID=UPI00234F12C3|nr:uncharacterized protein LOC123525313 [Mercenaria mercenaria]